MGKRGEASKFDVEGTQLLRAINRLVAEGDVLKLHIRSDSGSVFLDVPLDMDAHQRTIISVPWEAAIAAIAGVTQIARVEIERGRDAPDFMDEEGDDSGNMPLGGD